MRRLLRRGGQDEQTPAAQCRRHGAVERAGQGRAARPRLPRRPGGDSLRRPRASERALTMARPLIIDDKTRAELKAANKRAEANPISAAVLKAGAVAPTKHEIKLSDRKPGFERPPSEHILIPVGYRVAVSVEEQPFGLARHISISVEKRGKTPNPAAVEM